MLFVERWRRGRKCRFGQPRRTWLLELRLGSVNGSLLARPGRYRVQCGPKDSGRRAQESGKKADVRGILQMTHIFAEHAELAAAAGKSCAPLAERVCFCRMDGDIACSAGRRVRAALGVQ